MSQQDTIVAIATPVGTGGIGIIKISGPDALRTVAPLFRCRRFDPAAPRPRHLYYGTVVDPRDARVLDEVLLSFMPAPHTYTGEDVVEINCHSGLVIVQKILALVLQNGARLAEPGEFTKRAFLNGRIDLAQAEAVIDVIEAKTEASLKIASQQLQGRLSEQVRAVQDELLEIMARVETAIDFPEDEPEIYDPAELEQTLAHLIAELERLSATYQEGRLYRLGVSTIIAGKPNVGKSSLLNALLGEQRALVTPFPGTTRDGVQETISIQGLPVVIQDSAGIHEGQDEIDKLGIDVARTRLAQAELVLLVIDGSAPLDERDYALREELGGKPVITIINKTDLPQRITVDDARRLGRSDRVALVSARYQQGIDRLRQLIVETVLQAPHDSAAEVLITSARHKDALERTAAALHQARTALAAGLSPELVAVDLRAALDTLGEITGKTTAEDVLDRIFSSFCIGK